MSFASLMCCNFVKVISPVTTTNTPESRPFPFFNCLVSVFMFYEIFRDGTLLQTTVFLADKMILEKACDLVHGIIC